MPIVIRTAFNNRDWEAQCTEADRDRRLFQCHESVVDTGYHVTEGGTCAAQCWEQHLCSKYKWHSTTGAFGERATGAAYFFYRDIDQSLVLWGKSFIRATDGDAISFDRFQPLARKKRVNGITYGDLEEIGVPSWRSGTFRYISDETASLLDSLIREQDGTLSDPSEEFWDIEGRARLRRHVTKERSARLIRAFKRQLQDFSCSICGFSFQETYGELGQEYIEAHHTVPMSELRAETKVRVRDLIAVCSNCHRMLHRRNPPLSPEELAVRQR